MNGNVGGSVERKQRDWENHVIYSRCSSCSCKWRNTASSSSTSECNRRKCGGRFKDNNKCFPVTYTHILVFASYSKHFQVPNSVIFCNTACSQFLKYHLIFRNTVASNPKISGVTAYYYAFSKICRLISCLIQNVRILFHVQ